MNNTLVNKGRDFVNLFTDEQVDKLYLNGLNHGIENIPVAHLVQPELKYQWLVTELYHEKPNIAFGLVWLNDGIPEVKEFDLSTIDYLNTTKNVVFNDPTFFPSDTLELFKAVSEERGFIVTSEEYSGAIFEKYRKLIY